ncbi:MAG: GIY-YIG nuclease family protein [Candidatus Methanofastidiosia archaeon]
MIKRKTNASLDKEDVLMKGSYILVVGLQNGIDLTIGKLGLMYFFPGFYAYVGSALNSLEPRLNRHLRKNKKVHWHIDYLLEKASIKDIFYKEGRERDECIFAMELSEQFDSVKNFGASDCRCKSHLFFSESYPKLLNAITELGVNGYEYQKEHVL